MGGAAAHGHGQYEVYGPVQSFGPASMAGGGYMPPHLRHRDRVSPPQMVPTQNSVRVTTQLCVF